MRTALLLLLVLLVCLPSLSLASEPIVKIAVGANAVGFDGASKPPSDYELGAAGRASLQPHISLVGGFWHGLAQGYNMADGGVMITATDVANQYFSVGFGAERQQSDKPELRPNEWQVKTNVGWVPWHAKPWFVAILQGSYGLGSDHGGASALVGVRAALAAF